MIKNKKIVVTIYGGVFNVFLSIIKILSGLYGNSMALVTDGIHSFSDLASDIVVIFGIKFGDKPVDDTHNYGHKKIETFSELIIGLVLLIVGIFFAYSSILSIYHNPKIRPRLIAAVVAFISIIIKEHLYRITKAVGKKENSEVLIANAWHHRTDSFSSLPVLIGILVIYFFPNLYFLDYYVSLILSFIIIKVGIVIIYKSFQKLIDVAPDIEIQNKIIKIIKEFENILDFHNIRMRYIGNKIFIDFHIQVNKNLNINDAHNISTDLKKELFNSIPNIYDVLIHIEPY